MTAPKCPSCNALLEKMPLRKTKCKACGEFMFVKSTPDNREKRLMTQAQAEVAEEAWAKRGALNKLLEQARVVGVDEESARAAFEDTGGNFKRAANVLFKPLALARNRDALLIMAHYVEEDQASKKMWMRLFVALDLKRVRDAGFSSAQLQGGGMPLCPACSDLDGKIVNTDTSAMEIVPANCVCESPGSLLVSGAIKRADGSVYFERLATPR